MSRPGPARDEGSEASELQRLRREVEALRQALGLQAAVEELPDCFEVLVSAVADDWLAVPLRQVQEVVPRVLLSPLPEAPVHVAGYMCLRGAYVPVVDMGRCWSGAALPERLEDRIVVVRQGGELRGLLVSGVEGVAAVEKPRLSKVRPDAPGADWALGFLELGQRALLLASLQRLLDPLVGLSVPEPESPAA